MTKYFFYDARSMSVTYDIYGTDMSDARKRIRAFLGVQRLSKHVQVWEA